jgi:hypothetical protein
MPSTMVNLVEVLPVPGEPFIARTRAEYKAPR